METTVNLQIILAFCLYLGCMMAIGVYYSNKQKNLSQYILGDRKLGPWLTSMSAEASDMSGWMLMGLPGYAYLNGLSAFWTGIGLVVGTWLNWVFISKRLRNYTEVANNSLTIPDYLSNRFGDTKNGLRLICAIFIILFFIIYTSSGFVAAGKLFNTIFGLPYTTSLLIGAFVVIFYTFLGGFSAVAWTDMIQGTMMFFTVIYIPVAATISLGGTTPTLNALSDVGADFFSFFPSSTGGMAMLVMIISSLGWGLGYFGQPHILVRFMAISDSKELRVFIIMAESLSSPFITGLIWSAVLAAIMSTASAQLLVTASAVSKDLYNSFFHKNASQKQLLLVSRITVLIVSICSLILASDPDSYIFSIVSYAWAGFGACFGPTILLSLYWKRMTLKGAYAGIISGGITVLIWKQFNWFGIYELVPGFIISILAIIIFSLADSEPSKEIYEHFEQAVKLSNHN